MAKIVAVHGINQQYRGSHTIYSEWYPALQDGLERADFVLDSEDEFRCAFYGDIFRGKGKSEGDNIPDYDLDDIEAGWEEEFLFDLSQEAIALKQADNESDAKKKKGVIIGIQRALNVVSGSPLFGNVPEKVVINFVKQVKTYLHNPEKREEIKKRVLDEIADDTRVLIGHSLGSVVCYELLCQNPGLPIKVYISLGSPLGIKRIIFDRLEPSPKNGIGLRPKGIKTWVNIADAKDIVALEKKLDPFFEGSIHDKLIDNGANAHNASRYLTTEQAGKAIKDGLQGG
ncbi:hypothetical protein [Crocosphaera sp. Alani8]|uniref:hypothetical protein n=1 Tax=Crocosphaera sp. Alani8 TaxID=3038952 RepID=UPI00313E3468